MNEPFLHNIRLVLQDLHRMLEDYAPILSARVDEILAHRPTDINKIDHLMDELFSIMQHGYGIADFQRLNAYLETLDPEAANYYRQSFHEWFTDI